MGSPFAQLELAEQKLFVRTTIVEHYHIVWTFEAEQFALVRNIVTNNTYLSHAHEFMESRENSCSTLTSINMTQISTKNYLSAKGKGIIVLCI